MTTTTKTLGYDLPDDSYLEVTIEERGQDSRLSPGFSITGSLWEATGHRSARARKHHEAEPDMAGQVHDEIIEAAPELTPFIEVHLADQQGLPMHAEANGWYFYSGQNAEHHRRAYSQQEHDSAAACLHISPEQLPTGLNHQEFTTFVDSLTDMYQQRAQTARALLHSLTDDRGVEPIR